MVIERARPTSHASRFTPLNNRTTTPRSRGVWPAVFIGLRVALLGLAVWALRRELSDLDMGALATHLRDYGWRRATLGVIATAASFTALGVMELMGLRYARREHSVPRAVGMTTGFVASALSQSIGVALLTGAAVRLRAYRRDALDASGVARVSAFVTVTVTLGLLATGAMAFLASSAPLYVWHAALPVRGVGALLAAVVMAYLAWSAFGSHDAIGRGAWRVSRPEPRLAAEQLALSAFDWIVTGSILYLVMPTSLAIEYSTALRVYLVAQTIGTLSHVPGGAGVFELLVIALLAPLTPPGQRTAIVASLVMFRVLYYLLPLIAAFVVAGIAELRAVQGAMLPRSAHAG
jgi:phosphatidylglycerol lysyltransferase